MFPDIKKFHLPIIHKKPLVTGTSTRWGATATTQKRKYKYAEYQLQTQVCKYLDLQYPDVLYLSDTIAHAKLTNFQAGRNKKIQKAGFKCPDLIILEKVGGFGGLFIELKTENPFTKDWKLKQAKVKKTGRDHLKDQNDTIEKLIKKGYAACFSWSFTMTKKIIDHYFKGKFSPIFNGMNHVFEPNSLEFYKQYSK